MGKRGKQIFICFYSLILQNKALTEKDAKDSVHITDIQSQRLLILHTTGHLLVSFLSYAITDFGMYLFILVHV
jgi:hypothetical protein